MKRLTYLLLIIAFLDCKVHAQTILSPRDIAVIKLQTDTTDSFSFITFVDLVPGTVIYFTSVAVNSSGVFQLGNTNPNDGTFAYTVPAGGLKAGDIKTWTLGVDSANFSVYTDNISTQATERNFSSGGDSVIVFQKTGSPGGGANALSSPTFISVIYSGSTQFGGSPTDTNDTFLPSGLSVSSPISALALGVGPNPGDEYDNLIYNGSFSFSSVEDAKNAFFNPSNYYKTNNAVETAYTTLLGNIPSSATLTPAASIPTITTSVANSINNTGATLGGNVTSDGGATVTSRGVVYSITAINSNPQISGTGVIQNSNGSGTGVFSKVFTGLSAGTQYSFNTYAINSEGTSYGTVRTFTTTGKGWTGATNTDWATASNWSPKSIPTITDNIVIPNVTNKPIISSNTGAVANNLTIDVNSSLTVNSGGSLIIEGNATTNGDFRYKIHVNDTNWHLVSSPVLGEQYDDTWNNANGINTNGTGSNEAVASYINTSDADGDWVYYQDGSGATTFGAGIGYSLNRTSVGNYTFVGNIPTPPVSPSITANDIGGANENRWTLVGNPFPAYINIATFLSVNATPLTNTHESVYVWNATTNEYQSLTTGYIHPGQGFFVNSNVAATAVTFTKTMQSHQTGVTFYRTTNPKITLTVDDGTKTTSTEINYNANKSTGLDPRFDIGTFTGQSIKLKVYTQLVSDNKGVNFMRQALPNKNYEAMIIPVGVKASTGQEITFTIEHLNLPLGLKVYLEDRVNNTFTRLNDKNSEYKTTLSEQTNGVGRFYLHTTSQSLSVKDMRLELKDIKIYRSDNTTIKIIGLHKGNASFQLYDIFGKEILLQRFKSNGIKEIKIPNIVTGIYFARIVTEQGSISKKINLN